MQLDVDQDSGLVFGESGCRVDESLLLFDVLEDSFQLHLVVAGLLLTFRNNINRSSSGKMHFFFEKIGDQAPSASPSRRPDKGPAQADATARWKEQPHSAEPEQRSTPTDSHDNLIHFLPTNSADEP